MIRDISANLYQKCLTLCSKILLNVLHNTSLAVLLLMQHSGFQISPILRAFLATFGIPFRYWQTALHMMIQRAYKYVSSSLQPCLTVFKLKITNMFNLSGWGLKKSKLPWEQIFYSHRYASCRTISLPSFNGLRCKLAEIALFNIYSIIIIVG